MEWLSRVQQQAQQAAEELLSSKAAERALALAAQATQQASALAQQATTKAQEVAKEAMGEAEKGLQSAFGQQAAAPAPAAEAAQYGLSPELERFVSSLSYSTFSDYPLDSLDVPAAPEAQRLSPWQEAHARLVLTRVPQLRDLRFVLCPRRMDEVTFWVIYFTLCSRYLPQQQEQQQHAGDAAGPSAGAAAGAAAAGAGAPPEGQSSSAGGAAEQRGGSQEARAGGSSSSAAAAAAGVASASAAAAAAAAGGGAGGSGGLSGSGGDDDDDLAQLADDPELSAYLEDALQLDGSKGGGSAGGGGGGGGSDELGSADIEDLDEYINALDSEVNADK